MRRARFFIGGEPAGELTECLLVESQEEELGGSTYTQPGASTSGGDGEGYEPPVMDSLFDGMVIMSAWDTDLATGILPAPAPAPPEHAFVLEPAQPEPEPEPEPEPLPEGAASRTQPGEQANTVRMVVPRGAKAGEIVTLETDQGEKISMALPAGATAGATIQFKVQQSFWDKADAAVGKLGAAAVGLLSNFLTGAEALPAQAPPRHERQAQVGKLAAGTLLCVPGCTRLCQVEGARQLPLASGELEIFAALDRSSICFNVRPEGQDEDDAQASSEQLMKGLVGNIPSSVLTFDQHGKQMHTKKSSKRPKRKEGQPPTLEEQAATMKLTLAAALAERAVEEQKARDTVELTTVTLQQKVSSNGGLGIVISDTGRVIAVGCGTAASEAGVVPGSRIRAVAGHETRGKAEIISAIQQHQQQQQMSLQLSIALPPPPCTATLRLWEQNTDAIVLEVEPGEFHFLCSNRSQAVCIVLPAGATMHGVAEAMRQVLTKWLGPTGLLTRFGQAARDAALAKSKAELAPAATVRKGLFSMMKAADLVISTARAAEHGVSQSGGGLFAGAKAGMNAVSTVRQQQELDPLRRLLPLDWDELPKEMEGAMTLLEPPAPGAANGACGNRTPCYACLKVRRRGAGKPEGWLVLFDKASAAARKARDQNDGGAPKDAEAARNAITLAKLAAVLDEASRWAEALPLYEQSIDASDAEMRRIIAMSMPSAPKPGTLTNPSQLSAHTLDDRQRQQLTTLREEVSLRRLTCAGRAVAIRRALGTQAPPPFLPAVSSLVSIEMEAAQESITASYETYASNRVAYCVSVQELSGVGPSAGLMHGIRLERVSETTLSSGAGQVGLQRGGVQVILAPNANACTEWTRRLAEVVLG